MGIPSPLHLGLTGYPLDHSLSPRIHTAALQALGLPGDYCLYPVPPLPEGAPALRALLGQVCLGELHGLNVTIPHKQSVLDWLDELTPVAQAVGAVNTIYCREGRLVGDNTDAAGFMADLEQLVPGAGRGGSLAANRTKTALVLGAGGSARAVVYGLSQAGWEVYVAARRLEQAEALAGSLSHPGPDPAGPASQVLPIRLRTASIHPLSSTLSLIVNATPLGMAPDLEASPWPAEVPLPLQAILYDLVYNPPTTALIRAAQAVGIPARNGLGMLVEQAALAFERWTGYAAPRRAMRQALSQSLSKTGNP